MHRSLQTFGDSYRIFADPQRILFISLQDYLDFARFRGTIFQVRDRDLQRYLPDYIKNSNDLRRFFQDFTKDLFSSYGDSGKDL